MKLVRRKSKSELRPPPLPPLQQSLLENSGGEPHGEKQKTNNTYKEVQQSEDMNMRASEERRKEIEPPEETDNLEFKFSRRFKYKTTGD